MAVYDCTTFWVENDLFEVRLNQHWDKVDKFIVIEAGETHTGVKKPLNFDHKRFEKWADKIVYRSFDSFEQAMKDYPHLLDDYTMQDRGAGQNSMDWARDHFQGNFILEALDDLGATDDDIIYASCCDEIIKHETFDTMVNILRTEKLEDGSAPILMFKYWLYAYKFNLLNKTWQDADSSGIASTLGNFRKILPATLRAQRICSHVLPNAGWHFTFMDKNGGEDILAKQRAWAHSRDVLPGQKVKFEHTTREEALERFFIDYKLTKVPLEAGMQPQYILDNLDKFKDFIFNE